jgi:hypothetical protein
MMLAIQQEIAGLDREIEERMRPFAQALERVDEIHGLGRRNAEEILAETGVDMSRFPSEAHLAFLGQHLSGEQRECRQTAKRQDTQKSPYLVGSPGGSFGRADKRNLPVRPLSPDCSLPGC